MNSWSALIHFKEVQGEARFKFERVNWTRSWNQAMVVHDESVSSNALHSEFIPNVFSVLSCSSFSLQGQEKSLFMNRVPLSSCIGLVTPCRMLNWNLNRNDGKRNLPNCNPKKFDTVIQQRNCTTSTKWARTDHCFRFASSDFASWYLAIIWRHGYYAILPCSSFFSV